MRLNAYILILILASLVLILPLRSQFYIKMMAPSPDSIYPQLINKNKGDRIRIYNILGFYHSFYVRFVWVVHCVFQSLERPENMVAYRTFGAIHNFGDF